MRRKLSSTAVCPELERAAKKFGYAILSMEKKETNEKGNPRRMYCQVKCQCGNVFESIEKNLLSWNTRSCGCLQRQKSTKHGMSEIPTYNVWKNMVQRCMNIDHPSYEYYGGRGITVCQEWAESFVAFQRDMGNKPDDLELDRIENDEGYSKMNCQWIAHIDNMRNKRQRQPI